MSDTSIMVARHESARAQAARVARGEVSALELVDAHIARIERDDARVNAVVVRRFEAARAEARAADQARRRAGPSGALDGVPITIKECFDLIDTPSTFGYPERAQHRATRNALAIDRLRHAGAIILGKTNVPKDLADWQSFNALYGTTLNPWDASRSAGGSSGGAAAALACGFAALELGSDIGGSIRVPAHFCGVYGHKPTFGIVPLDGHSMIEDAPAGDLNVAGPLARSADDLALALSLIAGHGSEAAWQLRLPPCPPELPDALPQGLRIAVIGNDGLFPVDQATQDCAYAAGGALQAGGAQVDIAARLPMDSEAHYKLYIALLRGATAARIALADLPGLTRQAARYSHEDDGYDALRLRGLTQAHRQWQAYDLERHRLQRAWRVFFGEYDAVIAPITPTCAFPHVHNTPKHEQRLNIDGDWQRASNSYFWIGLPTVSGLPATAIPAGTSRSGLPVGLQIIGPEFSDLRTIGIAGWLERHFRGFSAPPGFSDWHADAAPAAEPQLQRYS